MKSMMHHTHSQEKVRVTIEGSRQAVVVVTDRVEELMIDDEGMLMKD